jgi:uncharacterized membrane protein
MMTYYICVTAAVSLRSRAPEWTSHRRSRPARLRVIVRPIDYYGYRFAQETSYQIIKTFMMLPALALVVWAFANISTCRGWDFRDWRFSLARLFWLMPC